MGRRPVRQRSGRLRAGFRAAAATLATVAVGGGASAYWSGYGGGTGSGDNETISAVTLSPATPVAELYPGGTTAVHLTITNSNGADVHLRVLSLATGQGAGGFAVDSEHSGCGVSELSFTEASNGGAGWTVPGAVEGIDGTLSATLGGALTMGLSAADACQGASVTVFLRAGS